MTTPPGTPQSDSKLRVPYKPRRSIKAPLLKATVIAKRSTGSSKSQIAKDLSISRNTVTSILDEGDFEQQIASGRISCISLIGKGAQAIEKSFDKGDGSLALRMFEGLGILGDGAHGRAPESLHLTQAVNIMFKAKDLLGKPTIEISATEPLPQVDNNGQAAPK
jgi:hypothetical protein